MTTIVSARATPGRPDVDDAASADEKAWSNPMGQPFDKSQDLWWSQQQDAAIKVKALSRWNNYCELPTLPPFVLCFRLANLVASPLQMLPARARCSATSTWTESTW